VTRSAVLRGIDVDGGEERAFVRLLEDAIERLRQKRLDLNALLEILKEKRLKRQQPTRPASVRLEDQE
jgi:hypothetical protein